MFGDVALAVRRALGFVASSPSLDRASRDRHLCRVAVQLFAVVHCPFRIVR